MLVDCPNCKNTVVTSELKIGDSFICPKCNQEAKYFHGNRGFNSSKTIGENIGTTNSTQSYKTCPYCAEKDLQVDAVVCKHCKRDLLPISAESGPTEAPQEIHGGFKLALIIVSLYAMVTVVFAPQDTKARQNVTTLESTRDAVQSSGWDSSVSQVKSWLKKELKEPGSLEFIDWSPVEKTDYGYMVRTRYRAKNSFGGYVVENKLFRLSKSGVVISCSDFK